MHQYPNECSNSDIVAKVSSIAQLDSILPQIVGKLSLLRGQLLLDQLKGLIESKDRHLLLITVGPNHSKHVYGVALCSIPPQRKKNNEFASNSATVLFAGLLDSSGVCQPLVSVTHALRGGLEGELSARKIEVVQWAFEPPQALATLFNRQFAQDLGFQPLSELEYLQRDYSHVPYDQNINSVTNELRLRPVDWEDSNSGREFVELVAKTYCQSLDCPDLASIQTPQETLQNYRASSAYAPDLWFKVDFQGTLISSSAKVTVGAVILARHPSPNGPVLELVYMGVLPEHRGLGMGIRIVASVDKIALQEQAQSIILAVDRRNWPAREIYLAQGYASVMIEEVWGRRLTAMGKSDAV